MSKYNGKNAGDLAKLFIYNIVLPTHIKNAFGYEIKEIETKIEGDYLYYKHKENKTYSNYNKINFRAMYHIYKREFNKENSQVFAQLELIKLI